MGYVIVEFPERREVFLNEVSQGYNRFQDGQYRILIIGDGQRTFRLGGALDGTLDYVPLTKTVVVQNTNPISPLRVTFTKVLV